MEDRRTIKTKRAIRQAFLELLSRKSINRISVVEISKLADLGRGTFYLHYKDVYDLMEHLEHELIADLEQLYDASYSVTSSANVFKFTETITGYMETNRDLFLILARQENGGGTLENIKHFFNQKLLTDLADTGTTGEKAEIIFVIAGVFGILESWLLEGMTSPRKNVSEILHQMLIKFED